MTPTRLFVLLAVVLCTLASSPLAASSADAPNTSPLLLVLDASGSMWGQIEGENKIVIARRVLGDLVDDLSDGSPVGVIAYGHRREGDCQDIETVVPLAPLDKAALKSTVQGLNPKGKTPLTASVQQALGVLEERAREQDGSGGTAILVSDGLETCGGDPCAVVRAAKERGLDFVLHVVGFDIAKEDVSSLECAAQAGGGLFLSAENADELAEALETAVALPAEIPAGRLSVKVVADGELFDAAVGAVLVDSDQKPLGGRTYSHEETNPRIIPLADGVYQVTVTGVRLKGATRHEFEVRIEDGGLVEKVVDFSTGELSVGVTNNGELSDAVYSVTVPGESKSVAGGRTYTSPSRNPATVRLTAGTYEVSVKSVKIGGGAKKDLGRVVIEPRGRVEVSAEFVTGVLKVGAKRDGQLVDAVVNVTHAETRKSVAGGRTYTAETSNPGTYVLEPGSYQVSVQEIRGAKKTFSIELKARETVERILDMAAE